MANPLRNPVKVGPFQFKFIETNLNPGSEASFNFGLTSFEELTCAIHNKMEEGVKKETSFHEFLHVVFMVTGLSERLEHEEEERIISTISPTIVAALQDNPEFTKYVVPES